MSSVLLSNEMQELFAGLTTPSCSQDKGMEGDGLLFPELDDGISTRQVSLLKQPTQKPTTVINLNLAGTAGNDEDLVSYLESMTAGSGSIGSSSPQHSDLEYMEHTIVHPKQGSAGMSRHGELSYIKDEDYDFDYSVDFKKPLGNLSMSKNAIAARENRQKKKSYVSNLETSVKTLSHENSSLKKNVNSLETAVDSLQTEVEYLKSVLANQGTLGALLKNIASTQGVKLRSSEFQAVAKSAAESSPSRPNMKRKKPVAQEENNSDSQKENDTCVNGVTTRIGSTRKIQKLDHDYAAAGSKKFVGVNGYDAESETDSDADDECGAGVCLHVSNKKVSLEFCASCSKKAGQATAVRRKKLVSRR